MPNESKENSIPLKREQPTLDSGLEALEMVMESKCGQMVHATKDIVKITELMAKENLFILTGIFTKAIGSTTKQTAMVYIST